MTIPSPRLSYSPGKSFWDHCVLLGKNGPINKGDLMTVPSPRLRHSPRCFVINQLFITMISEPSL